MHLTVLALSPFEQKATGMVLEPHIPFFTSSPQSIVFLPIASSKGLTCSLPFASPAMTVTSCLALAAGG
jgi:hypothetical protein